MVEKILQMLRMACPHKNMSHPFASGGAAPQGRKGDWEPVGAKNTAGHYIVCLDCGRKFNYDWNNMKVVK